MLAHRSWRLLHKHSGLNRRIADRFPELSSDWTVARHTHLCCQDCQESGFGSSSWATSHSTAPWPGLHMEVRMALSRLWSVEAGEMVGRLMRDWRILIGNRYLQIDFDIDYSAAFV